MRQFFKILTKADIFLISFLMLVAVSIFVKQTLGEKPSFAYIFSNNKLFAKVSLVKEDTILLPSGNVAQILDGKIAIVKSETPKQIAVKQGFSNRLPIVNLPDRIVITFDYQDSQMLITK